MSKAASPAVLIFSLALAACGKPAPSSEPAPAAPPASAETPPAAPTEANRKAALASLPVAYQAADLDNGQAKFALCKSCHTAIAGGAAMTGPNLYGVFGRKAGSVPGFAYSDGLKASAVVWDAVSLDKWIADPRAMVAATKMTFIGIKDAKDRRDVIAYLKVVTTPKP